MIRTILLDDCLEERNRLEQLIQQYSNYFEMISFSTVNETSQYLRNNIVDVIFMDIELENQLSFDLLNTIKSLTYHPLIVYVSHYPKYLKECFGYQVIKFIEKNEVERILPKTLKDLEDYFEYRIKAFQYKNRSNTNVVLYRHIISFERDGDYALMTYLKDQRYVEEYLDISIVKLEEQLDEMFIKINQSVIVNTLYIEEMAPPIIKLCDSRRFVISKQRKKEVISKYHQAINKYIVLP